MLKIIALKSKKLLSGILIFSGEEKGAVFIIAAAIMVCILGVTALVVDTGSTALEKSRLQSACDAAALAGAVEMPYEQLAREKALEYLEYNGVNIEEALVTLDSERSSVTVKASREVSYTFARILGQEKGTVNASSTAAYGVVTGMTGVVPFGIPDQTLVYGQEYKLKAGSQDQYGPGNYGPLALEFRGASSYENNLKYGYNGMVNVGDWVYTEPGNMSGPTETGVLYRLGMCSHTPRCSVDKYDITCPMVMIVPIFDPTSLIGRNEVCIVGFAAFLLKGVDGGGSDSEVTGYFLKTVPPDGLKYEIDPNQTDYGLRAAKLLE
jgi:Flp pilus assembly protein TadG